MIQTHKTYRRRASSLSLISMSLLALAMSLMACSSEPSKQEIIFKVNALDTTNAPVADVQFFINDDPYMFGKTNQVGVYEDRYDAKVGDTLRLRLVPPEGYQIIGDSEISMQVTEGDGGPLEVEFNGIFAPPKRNFLFVVDGRPGDQVIIENEPVYQIGDSRRGMFIHLGSPGQSFVVQVGDSAAYQWTYAQGDEIYVITNKAQHTLVETGLTPQKVLDNPQGQPMLAVAKPSRAPSLRIKSKSGSRARSSSRSSSRSSKPKPASIAPTPVDPEPDPIPSPVEAPKAEEIDLPNPTPEEPTLVASKSTLEDNSDGFEDSAPIQFEDPQPQEAPPTIDNEIKDPVAVTNTDSAEVDSKSPSTTDLLATLGTKSEPDTAIAPPPPPPSQPPPPPPKKKRKKKRASRSKSKSKTTTAPIPGNSLQNLSKSEIKDRVEQIGKGYDSSSRLSAADVHFLKQLSKSNGTTYNAAHRILGAYYYNIKEYRRQRDSLEIATKKGRYRSDAKVLLSLAQAYGHFKQYSKALKTLRRAEAKMRRLNGSEKANVYRTYAEYSRLYFIAQRAKNPLRADTNLLDTAIQKWKRLQSISSAGSKDASDARKQIQKLEQMKSEAGMP